MKFVFFLICYLIFIISNAQITMHGNIKVIAKYAGDSVVLRWSPNNYLTWKVCNKYAFVVEKKLYIKDSITIVNQAFQKVNSPAKLMSLQEMKNYLGPNSKLGAVAAQATYGKEFTPNLQNAADLKNASIEEKNRFGFAMYAAENDAKVATALGLRMVDNKIEPNSYYVYRVYIMNNSSNTEIIDTGYVVVNTHKYSIENAMPILFAENLQNAIRLNWNDELFENNYSGYFLEKRKYGTTNWTRINSTPMIRTINEENPNKEFYFIDSVEINYEKMEYRLVGLTAFAELINSKHTVIGYGKDLTAPAPAEKLSIKGNEKYQITFSWEKAILEPDFLGFHVQKSYFAEGPFTTVTENILSKNTMHFFDTTYHPIQPTFYRVIGLDTAKNASVSLSIYAYFPDSIAPNKPKEINGYITKKGITKLNWKMGIEKDLYAYRVYRANQADHEFINITPEPITDTTFIDTIALNTLTKKIYYKIAAVDYHFNHSEMSEALELKRPDIMKPANPVFKEIIVSDTVVLLQWHNSPSDDVKQTWLIRQTNNEKLETIMRFNGNKIAEYKDKNIKRNNIYKYFLLAVDESDILSDTSKPVDAFITSNKMQNPVTDLTVTKIKDKKILRINWNYKMPSECYFVIYRNKNKEGFMALSHTNNNTQYYDDWDSAEKGEYQYYIVAFFVNGLQSAQGKTVSITTE